MVSELAEPFSISLQAVSWHISKYWQSQFDTLAAWLDQIERAKHELAQRGTTKRNVEGLFRLGPDQPTPDARLATNSALSEDARFDRLREPSRY